jgi:O-antigen/teichoic acid export membrane protein
VIAKRTILAGLGWSAVMAYANRALGLATTLILAKVLSPQDFGLVALASMLIEALRVFKDAGLSEALIQHKNTDAQTIDTAHSMLVGFHVALFLLAVILAPLAAGFYNNPAVMPVVIVMASNLVWDSTRAVPRTLFRKNLAFRQLVLPEVLPLAVSSAISIVMALTGFGVWSLVAKTVIHSVMGMILISIVSPYRPRFGFHRASAVELFHYAKFIAGASLLAVVLYNIDKFYISRSLGLAALGVYELAMRISDMPVRELSFVIGSVMFPVFSKMEGSSLERAFITTLKYTAFFSIPAAIGISVYGPPLVHAIYGAKWQALGQPLQILALYALFRSLSAIVLDTFKAIGAPRMVQHFVGFKLLVIGLLGIPALRWFGLVGICSLVVLTYAIGFVLELATLGRLAKVSVKKSVLGLVRPLLIAAVTLPGVYELQRVTTGVDSLLSIGLGIALSGALYLGGLLAFERRSIEQLRGAFRRPRPSAA